FNFKLHKNPDKSFVHKWRHLENISDYSFYKQFDVLKKNYCDKIEMKDEDGNISLVDPFDIVSKHSELRPIIIEKQHKDMVNSFHELHPFRFLNYVRKDYKAFQTFEKQQLNRDFVKDIMINNYRELFYNFDTKINYCNICRRYTNKPIEYHLIINCVKLNELRHIYWNHARFEFAKIGSEYDTTHQQLFTQHLIEICYNINNYKNQLWSLICGRIDSTENIVGSNIKE
ncbi:MAG: hypothetical protein GY739_13110, partial [Mesoflavibacter sp.]|nr:hypothetical protein [Mesoflavibacter sp.]